MLSQVDPLLHGVCFDIGFIEINNPLIVVAVAIDIAAQRRFAGAGSSFNQIHFSFPEERTRSEETDNDEVAEEEHDLPGATSRTLEEALEQAIKDENYELAAQIRDQINSRNKNQ